MPPSTHGWLFHVEGRSVVATHWEPIFAAGNDAGSVVNVETLPASVSAPACGCWKPKAAACASACVPRGRWPLLSNCVASGNKELPIKADRAEIELRGYGWIEVECASPRVRRPNAGYRSTQGLVHAKRQ